MKISFEACILTSISQVIRVDQLREKRSNEAFARVVVPDFVYLADQMGSTAKVNTAVDILPTGVFESWGMLERYGVDAFDHALSFIAKEYCAASPDANARFLMVLEDDYYDTRTFVFPEHVEIMGEREFFNWLENIEDSDQLGF